jgi:hypothetical protein
MAPAPDLIDGLRFTDGDLWIKASEIVDKHGPMIANYPAQQLAKVLADHVNVEHWRRVVAAVDIIVGTLGP